jgi:CDP-diacylglycerol--glycerol-3-phosphate 3-phosphatidyltransferase
MSNTDITVTDKFFAATLLKLLPDWVTPNHITTFRFFTIPFVLFFLVIEYYIIGIPLFVISALSDALDGAKARTANQITDWGKLYDPVADKLLIGSVAVVVITSYMSPALAFIIIGLEMVIVALALYQKRAAGAEIEAKWAGKIKMIAQSFGIVLLLVYIVWPVDALYILSLGFLYSAIFFALLSIFVYKTI